MCLVDDSKRQQPHVFKCKTKPTFYTMLLLYIVIVTSTPLRPVGSVCNLSQSDSNEMIKATGSFFLVLFSQGRSAEWLWRSISNLCVCVTLSLLKASAYCHPVPALYYSSFSLSRFALTYSNPVGDKVFFIFFPLPPERILCVCPRAGTGWGRVTCCGEAEKGREGYWQPVQLQAVAQFRRSTSLSFTSENTRKQLHRQSKIFISHFPFQMKMKPHVAYIQNKMSKNVYVLRK